MLEEDLLEVSLKLADFVVQNQDALVDSPRILINPFRPPLTSSLLFSIPILPHTLFCPSRLQLLTPRHRMLGSILRCPMHLPLHMQAELSFELRDTSRQRVERELNAAREGLHALHALHQDLMPSQLLKLLSQTLQPRLDLFPGIMQGFNEAALLVEAPPDLLLPLPVISSQLLLATSPMRG